MARVGVLLDVVLDPALGQRRLERRGGAAQVAVPSAVARDDRAGAVERREVPRQHPVVDHRRLPPRPARQHEGEPAAHAEPDHPDRAVARRVGDQPGPGGVEVVEGSAAPAAQRPPSSVRGRPRRGHASAGRGRARRTPARRAGRRAAASRRRDRRSRARAPAPATAPHPPAPPGTPGGRRPSSSHPCPDPSAAVGVRARRRRRRRPRCAPQCAGRCFFFGAGRVGSSSTGSTCSGTLTGRR